MDRPAADCAHDVRKPGAGNPLPGGSGSGRRRAGRPGLADRRRGPGDHFAAAPAGIPLVRAPGEVADVHPGPCRRGQGAGPPVPAGGFGPVRRGVLLGGHREDHQRLRGRPRGRDRRVHRGYRGVERGPAGHRVARLGFGHGIAGARRLRRLRGRAGTRLRVRRAECGCPRLADQAPGHRQPLAAREVFPRGDDPPRPPRARGDPSPRTPLGLAGDRYLAGPDQRGADRRVGARPAGRAVAAGPRPHPAPARAARGPRGPAAHAALAARPRGGGPAPHRPALHRSRPGHRGGRGVRLARPARRHAPAGTRRIPAAHAARHGPDRDGSIRRRSTSLVLTKTGKLMTADPAARWHIGTAALIGPDDGPQPDFSVAVREAALMVILTSGPTGYDELTKQLTDLHGVEGWAAGGGAGAGRAGGGRHGTGLHSTGLASAVRTELYALRHRLWALHLLGTERSFSAPLSLTETGVAAALSALLARALRPRHHLGLG